MQARTQSLVVTLGLLGLLYATGCSKEKGSDGADAPADPKAAAAELFGLADGESRTAKYRFKRHASAPMPGHIWVTTQREGDRLLQEAWQNDVMIGWRVVYTQELRFTDEGVWVDRASVMVAKYKWLAPRGPRLLLGLPARKGETTNSQVSLEGPHSPPADSRLIVSGTGARWGGRRPPAEDCVVMVHRLSRPEAGTIEVVNYTFCPGLGMVERRLDGASRERAWDSVVLESPAPGIKAELRRL